VDNEIDVTLERVLGIPERFLSQMTEEEKERIYLGVLQAMRVHAQVVRIQMAMENDEGLKAELASLEGFR